MVGQRPLTPSRVGDRRHIDEALRGLVWPAFRGPVLVALWGPRPSARETRVRDLIQRIALAVRRYGYRRDGYRFGSSRPRLCKRCSLVKRTSIRRIIALY